jgi:hypothetical protein
MRFGYRTFRGEIGEFSCRSFTMVGQRNDRRTLGSVLVSMDVEFEIIRDTQAAITTRFNQIKAAILKDGGDVGFYQDNGARSAIFIDSSRTTSGVYITQHPSIVQGDGADYATHLKGSCSFAADLAPEDFGGATANDGGLTRYQEVMTFRGNGGPRKVVVAGDRGDPVSYTLCDRTPVYATQSGRATWSGNRVWYPPPNPPLFPGLLDGEHEEPSYEIADATGGRCECTTIWNYPYQSVKPIFGRPKAR